MNDDDTIFDPVLVDRLARPARRPGLVDLGQARSALTRHRAMTAGLPLAEVASRYVDVAEQRHAGPTTPIVYARPASPPSTGHPAPVGSRPTGPAAGADAAPAGTAPVTAGPAPTRTGPTAPTRPVPVAAARRPPAAAPSTDDRSAAPAGGPPVGASGPVVPARPARSAVELSPVWTATGPAVAGRATQPATSRPAVGRPLTIQRKVAAATLSTGPGSGSPSADPAGRPASGGRAAATGSSGATAGSATSVVAGPTGVGPAAWSELIGDARRVASGSHLIFRTPAAPDHPGRPAAGAPSAVGQRPPAAAPAQVVTARRPAAGPVPPLPLAASSAAAPQVRPTPGPAGVPSPAGVPPYPAHVATGYGAAGDGGRGSGARDVGGQRPGGPGVQPPRADRGVPQPPGKPAAQVDVGQVTEQVHGRIMRQLAVEAERRGVRR